MADYTIVLCI